MSKCHALKFASLSLSRQSCELHVIEWKNEGAWV